MDIEGDSGLHHTKDALSVHPDTTRVTENDKDAGSCWLPSPATLTREQLQDARWLALTAVPASPQSVALAGDLVARITRYEDRTGARKRRRGEAGIRRQTQAIGAILGGVLRRWSRDPPEAVFRSRKRDDFSGGLVAARQYLAACDALVRLGLVQQSGSIRFGFGISDTGETEQFFGKAPRLWPTQALLDLAATHGVIPTTLASDFVDTYPAQPPAVPQPIQLFALKQLRREQRVPLPIRRNDPDAARLRAEVGEFNDWISRFDFSGCAPPRFKRVFAASWSLGGRWYSAGNDGNYQLMSEASRLAIRIGGEPVTEVDVRASHLSIMHGLLGLPMPEGDPYRFPDAPRSVVKAWITASLGKGTSIKRWPRNASRQTPEIAGFKARDVGSLICARYRFLVSPARAVASAAGLDKLADLGPPERLLTHRLMAIEAQALTGAMQHLRARGVPALPVHDGLLVPATGAGYVGGALTAAYSYFANRVRIRCKLTVGADPRHAFPES